MVPMTMLVRVQPLKQKFIIGIRLFTIVGEAGEVKIKKGVGG